jgi:charged multivesicular body protein 2A
MGNIFGKEKPLKEVLRENKRMITKAIRELDRERTSLEREEKRLTMEIKKMAKLNQMNAVKIMAKDLVRTRSYVTKFIEMRSHLQSCGLKLQTVKSHQAMGEAMKKTTKAMVSSIFCFCYNILSRSNEQRVSGLYNLTFVCV